MRQKNRRVVSVKRPKLLRGPARRLKPRQRRSDSRLRRQSDCVKKPKRKLSG